MKAQGVKRILAAVLAGCLLSAGTAGAADAQEYAAEETIGQEESDLREEMQEEAPGDADLSGSEAAADEAEYEDEAAADAADGAEREGEAAADTADEAEREDADDPADGAASDASEEPDARTMQLVGLYRPLLSGIRMLAVGTYESELARFPESYKPYLEALHGKHPNWIFVAMDTKLDWDDVVKKESVSGSAKGTNQSLLPKSSAGILLSKASTDYEDGEYVEKDKGGWVSASVPAVAYYVDPRNYLTDNYIFVFEALDYNDSYHTLSGVEKALEGTDLSSRKNKSISYTTTKGKKAEIDMTYAEAIYAAGKKNKVSPLFLASKIRQETGAKLDNHSLSGKYQYNGKSYRGYYNYYNIGAYATSTGSPVVNGLVYAKGGADGKSKKYGRPWTSPVLAIDGGAQFLAESYIAKGQNTIYYQKFNTAAKPYYEHQYMQNLTAAASEAKTTYNSYKNMGLQDSAYVFYVPVYKGMPSQESTVSISKSVKTGKIVTKSEDGKVTLRKGPSTDTEKITTIPKGKKVTVTGVVHADITHSVSQQETEPYWYKVKYDSRTGYVSYRYVDMDTDSTIKAGATKQLNVTSSEKGEKIYYETSDPAVATVSASGLVKGVKKGNCDIYAVSASGRSMDSVGISVGASASSGEVSLSAPKLSSASNVSSGITIKWKKVSGAGGYYVYRRLNGKKSWTKIKTISSGSTVKYTDKTAKAGKKYDYTVKAYKGSTKSSCDKTGLTIRRLTNPVLVSASGTKTGIKVKWKKVTSAVSYEIYRKKKGGSFKKIAEVQKGSTVSYTDKTAEKNTTYYYTVGARSGVYRGAYNTSGVKGKRK